MVGRPPMKVALLGLVLAGLVGIVAFAAVREATTTGRLASPAPRPALTAARRALTAAEEKYARALWSVHEDVKGSAFRMTMSGLNYKIGDIGHAELQNRIQRVAEAYRRAESQVQALEPPPSLREVHGDYLEALRLYQRSAEEMLRTGNDGRDDHLVTALPLSQEASRKLLLVGNRIWPGEYVPN
jgi:hypothetical protein